MATQNNNIEELENEVEKQEINIEETEFKDEDGRGDFNADN